MSLPPTLSANYTNSAVINTLNDGVVDFTTEQDGQGLKIINNTTSGYLEISSAGAIVSPDGVATYPINFKDLSAITTNTTPQELVVVNTIAVQDATTTPPNNIQIQAGVIGVGTNFGIEYSSSTDQDFTIFCDENNTGGVLYKQQGFGATTTQTKITQGTIVSSNTANSNAITINPTSITLTDGTNTNTITATSAGASNTLQQVLDAGNVATGANATISLTNSGVGYTTNPTLIINNSNATAGNTTGVPSIELTKSGRNGAINDVVGSVFFNALDGAGVERTFGKIESTITTNTAPSNYDGALDFYSLINGTNNLVFRLNGADNENNSFRPFDLNGNALKTSTGNLNLDATSSTGTGQISLNPKASSNLYVNGDMLMATNNTIYLNNNLSLSLVATTIGNGGMNITDTTTSNSVNIDTGGIAVGTSTTTTYYTPTGFYNNDNSIYCNTSNGFNLNYGSSVNKTTLDLGKLEIYNAGTGGLLNDTILLQNTGVGNPVFNLNSFDANTAETKAMGASNSGVSLTYTNSVAQTKNISMNNPVGSASIITHTDNISSLPLQITSNQRVEISASPAQAIQLNSNSIELNGASLLVPSAGGNSGQFLQVMVNGTNYVINLLNP